MLVKWEKLSGKYNDTLILGNGASIAVSPLFSYGSLYGKAKEEGIIENDVEKIFDCLKTTDFEQVMRYTSHAHHINQALDIKSSKTEVAYNNIRNGLIKVVRSVHPNRKSISTDLKPVYNFMKDFKTVFSLSYDLIVYWAMLEGNNALGLWFKDCFDAEGCFADNWEPYRKPYGKVKGATLIFYPHGNLALCQNLQGDIFKIKKKESQELLDTITETWEDGKGTPLFICEGQSKQKEKKIGRFDYLNHVYNQALFNAGNQITIYGWNIAQNDEHILRKISKKDSVQKIAVSIYTKNELGAALRPDEIAAQCAAARMKIMDFNKKAEVVFFDAEDKGCWKNP